MRLFIVFMWISRLVLLSLWWFTRPPFSNSFFPLCCDESYRCCCGPLLRESSRSWCDHERSLTRLCGSTVAELSSKSCGDESGCVRSRDLDLSSLLERSLCSADGCGSTNGDEWFISKNSPSDISSASGVSIGWPCGTCGACAWGYVRSRDLDRLRDLSSITHRNRTKLRHRGTRSREFFLGPTLSLSPAGDGSGGHRGAGPGGSRGPENPLNPQGTSKSSQKVGGDGLFVSSPPSFSGVIIWGWRPKVSFQKTTIVHARGSNEVLKKVNWTTGQTLTPIGLERSFSEEYPSSGFTAGSKDVEVAPESALKQHTALKLHMR